MHIDINPPANWGSVRGYVLPGDGVAFDAAAGLVRAYVVPDTAAREKDGPLATYLNSSAAAVGRLAALAPETGIADITAAAAERGISPRNLVPPPGPDKVTLPTHILAARTGAGQTAFFAGRLPDGAQTTAATGYLHCLVRRKDGKTAYGQGALSQIPAGRLSVILSGACNAISLHLPEG